MIRYSLIIVQKSRLDKLTITHIQCYGRSEFEALGYAIKHCIFKDDGEIVFTNLFDCDKPAKNDNRKALLAEKEGNKDDKN